MGTYILVVVSGVLLSVGLFGLFVTILSAFRGKTTKPVNQCPDCFGAGIDQSGSNGMLGPSNCPSCGGR
jgi:hypothetical protein